MDFNTYQKEAKKTAIYPEKAGLLYVLLGLIGEVGETVEIITKDLDLEGEFYNTFYDMIDVGKFAEILKKQIRDKLKDNPHLEYQLDEINPKLKNKLLNNETLNEIKKEISDIGWYWSGIATEMGFALEDIAKTNIEKLRSRQERGQLGGSGNNR